MLARNQLKSHEVIKMCDYRQDHSVRKYDSAWENQVCFIFSRKLGLSITDKYEKRRIECRKQNCISSNRCDFISIWSIWFWHEIAQSLHLWMSIAQNCTFRLISGFLMHCHTYAHILLQSSVRCGDYVMSIWRTSWNRTASCPRLGSVWCRDVLVNRPSSSCNRNDNNTSRSLLRKFCSKNLSLQPPRIWLTHICLICSV